MANGKIPQGKYTIPAIALISTGIGAFLEAPISTTAATIGGIIGGSTVNSGAKLASGKSWAENIHNYTGLDAEAAEMTNPGTYIGGALPFTAKGSRTLLSVGDQIIKDAAKDVVQYGLMAVSKNPRGWVRPYVDQVKNGWQGWKDMKLAQRNGTISTSFNKPLFAELGKDAQKGDYRGKMVLYPNSSVYETEKGIEAVGENVYYIGSPKRLRWGITQNFPYYNTYNFHIEGGPRIGRITTGADHIRMSRTADGLPKGSYITDYPYPTTGQIGMSMGDKSPTLGDMIKMSKMSNPKTLSEENLEPFLNHDGKQLPETYLATGSYKVILDRAKRFPKMWLLGYQNGYMPYFNSQSELGNTLLWPKTFTTLPIRQQQKIVNDFITSINPHARKAFIGLDGNLNIPIPVNFKIN